jgi:hypothetical protein
VYLRAALLLFYAVDTATDQQARQVSLRWVCGTLPSGDGYQTLDRLDSLEQLETLSRAAHDGRPIWLELALTDLGEDEWGRRALAWFQGTLDAWVEMDVPVVDWSEVASVLTAARLEAPRTPTPRSASFDCRFLEALPHLYGRGVARTAKELVGDEADLAGTSLFPTVGFLEQASPDGAADRSPAFWTVRLSVAVIRNVVLTLRLPDLLCSRDATDEPDYRPGTEPLAMPDRFLPLGRDADQHDIAEGIAIYQASTVRSVAERIRAPLRAIERESRDTAGQAEDSEKKITLDDLARNLKEVVNLTETVHQFCRHVASLLRRFGAHGDADGSLVSPDIKLRYRFGIDEITSLRDDCRLVRDAIAERMATLDQTAREHFQVTAAVLGSAVLVPGLVAAIYSADVKLPAENSWPGFALLLCLIAGFSALAYWMAVRFHSTGRILELREPLDRLMPAAAALTVLSGVLVAVVAAPG